MRGEAGDSRVPALKPQGRPRTAGFRFSLIDAAAIVLCAIATTIAWPTLGSLALLLPYVLGHFFLFCNVFRVRRKPELVWAGLLLVNFGFWIALGHPDLALPLLTQLVVTLAVIVRECRQPTYHGVFARALNPAHLDRYLSGELS